MKPNTYRCRIMCGKQSGQSEVLGIVLLLALTMMAIGGVLYFAEPAISGGMEISESAQIENEFSLVDSKMATSALGASSAQNVEMNLHGGELEADPEGARMKLYHNFTEEQVRMTNRTLGWDTFREGLNDDPYNCGCNDIDNDMDDIQEALNRTLVDEKIGKVEYTDRDEKIAYEGGAVWKKNLLSNESVMISPPEFHYSPAGQTLTIPLFNVTSEFYASSTADRNIRIRTTEEPNQLFDENPIVGGSVKAEIQSDYYRAWARYFDTRTAGNIGEENIDDENQTALVELEVPVIEELDGGHYFGGPVESGYFEGDPSTGDYFLSASSMIDERVRDARNDNDNQGTCLEGNNLLDDNSCSLEADGSDAVYYVEDGDMSDVEFDIEDGNITLAVDDSPDFGADWTITEEDDSHRVDVLFKSDENGEIRGDNALNNPDSGNSSQMILYMHSNIKELELRGGSADEHKITLYAPNTYIRVRGVSQFEWEGSMVASGAAFPGSEDEQIKQGDDVDIDVGGAADTITFLQVTENEITVE